MWPFDDEEEQDSALNEFDTIAQEIMIQTPDLDTGLELLRETYSQYEFKNKEQAKNNFMTYSDTLRKEFQDTKPFDYQTVMQIAPIDLDSIIPEGEDEDQLAIDRINKWEEQNLAAIDTTEDPAYMQSSSQLGRGIRQIATAMRRDVYGADNYLVTDLGLRTAQGLVGPLASLAGADSVNDWFVENTDPDGVTILGTDIGGDDSFWSALSSGIGSVTGAVAGGIATTLTTGTPWGAAAYLGAAGAGATVQQVRDSLEAEATVGEAATAGLIEGISQTAQAAVGGKIFGAAVSKALGKEAVQSLGAKVVPRAIGAGVLEGTTEALGQVASNVATNIGQGTDADVLEGFGTSFVVGGLLGAGADVVGGALGRRRGSTPQDPTIAPPTEQQQMPEEGEEGIVIDGDNLEATIQNNPEIAKIFEAAAIDEFGQIVIDGDKLDTQVQDPELISLMREQMKLAQSLSDLEGEPPPPPEAYEGKLNSVKISPDAVPAFELEGGSVIVKDGEALHVKVGDNVLQSFDGNYFVDPATTAKVRAVAGTHAPDGTAITLVSDDGKLYLESEFLNEDLTVAKQKTGVSRREVPASTTEATGAYLVQADKSKITETGREHNYFISHQPIKATSSVGARHISQGTKERGYATKARERYGREMSERLGLETTSYEVDEKGNITEVTVPLLNYFPRERGDGYPAAVQMVQERGPAGALAYLQSKEIHTADEQELSKYLLYQAKEAVINASRAQDIKATPILEDFLAEVIATHAQVGTPVAQSLNARIESEREAGLAQMYAVEASLLNEAKFSIEAELGTGTTLQSIAKEVQETTAALEAATKEAAEPVEQELAAIEAEIQEIEGKQVSKFTDQITKYTDEINQLKEAEVEAKENIAGELTATDKALLEAAAEVEQQIQAVENEIQTRTEETLAPTKEQVDKEKNLETRIQKQEQRSAALKEEVKKLEEGTDEESAKQLKEQQAKHKTKITSYKTEVKNLEAKIKESKKELATLRKEREKESKKATKKGEKPKEPTQTQLKKEKSIEDRIEKQFQRAQTLKEEIKKLEKDEPGLTEKQEERKAAKLEQKKAEIEQVEQKLAESKQALVDLRTAKDERTATTKEPTAAQKKKLETLRGQLSKINEQFGTVKNANPKQAASVKKIRSLIAERKRAIRKLEKEKQLPRSLTPRQKQLVEKKENILVAQREGRIRIDRDKTNRLVIAKTAADKAKAKEARAKKILEEKMSKFEEKDKESLRNFYNLLDKLPEGEEKHAVKVAIFNTLSKYVPETNGQNKLDTLFTFWRNNVLSGWDTQLRNLYGNLGNVTSTIAAYGVTEPAGAVMYAEGWVRGLARGKTEAIDILLGNRAGRTKLDFEGETLKKPNIITFVPEVMRRLMSATDALFYRSAVEGQASIAEYIASKKKFKTFGERRAFVQNALFNTKAQLARMEAEVEGRAATLREAGIIMTPAQKKMAVFEAMERNRSEVIQKISQRHGERAVFQQEPEGLLGSAARMLKVLENENPITIKNKVIYPFKYVFPFARTIANVTNVMLDHTPVGFARAKSKNSAALRAVATAETNMTNALASNDATAIEKAQKELNDARMHEDVIALELREHVGRAMIGTTLLGAFFSMAYQYKDDENPYIEFYGNYPKGKFRDWQAKGILPYSMRIGDTVIGLQNTPLAVVAAAVGGAMQSAKDEKSIPMIAANMAVATMGAVATLSFVKQAGELFDVVTGAKSPSEGTGKTEFTFENSFEGSLANLGRGFIPASGFLSNLGKYMEASPAETYTNFTAKMFGYMPGAIAGGATRKQLDLFGRPIERNLWDRTALGSFLTWRTTDPKFRWMAETNYTITDPGPVMKLTPKEEATFGATLENKYGYADVLTPEQSRDVLKLAGPEIAKYIDSIRTKPEFQKFDEKRQKQINEEVNKIRARARYRVLMNEANPSK